MMRDAEKTVGNMIDKLKTAFIGSIDGEGFPTIKAMLQPRKREGIKTIYLTTNTSSCVWRNTGRTTMHVSTSAIRDSLEGYATRYDGRLDG